MRRPVVRIFADLLLCGAVLYLPWWVSALLALLSFFLFEHFYEMLVAAFLLDLLYGAPSPHFGTFRFVMSSVAVVLFMLGTVLKRHLRPVHLVY